MARKLALVIAFISTLVPLVASGLGFGNIESKSALNQPLDARIPLLSADSQDLDSVSVSLASPKAFKRAGVDRPFSLSRLRFQVVKNGGKPYIHVTSRDPIKEPFLDFLLEVQWSGGRVMREYTLLLDPPVYTKEQSAPVAVNGSSSSAPQTTSSASTSQSGATSAGAQASAAPAGGGRMEETGPISAQAGTYGPVQTSDTLWKIALKTRPDSSVTAHQMMMALFRANPDAFLNNNINELKAGAVLRVPAASDARSVSANAARRQVAQQMRDWRLSHATGQGSKQAGVSGGTQEQEAQGKLKVVAPPKGDGAQAGGADTAASGENIQELKQQITMLREQNASLKSENEELNNHVSDLNERVKQLQHSVNVKLDQAAAPAGAEAKPEESAQAGQTPAPEQKAAESASEANKPEAVAEAKPEQPAQEQPTQAEAKPEEQQKAAPQEKPAAPRKPAVVKPKPAPEPQLWEDPMVQMVGLGVIVVLLALVWLVVRRRRAAGGEASIGPVEPVTSPDSGQADEELVEAAAAEGAEDRFAGEQDERGEEEDEFDLGGEPLETAPRQELPPEGDVLDEAEVYLAYGRYDQARDALSKALEANPERNDIRAKLLEVFALTEDRPAFETEAQELHSRVSGSDDPTWQRAVELGREIAPENALFQDGVESPVSEPSADWAADAQASEPESVTAAESPEEEGEDEFGGLDFNFERSEPEEEATAEAAEPEPETASDEESSELDFGLDFDLNTDQGADEQESVTEDAPEAAEIAESEWQPAAEVDEGPSEVEIPAEEAEEDYSEELQDFQFDLGETPDTGGEVEAPAEEPAPELAAVDDGSGLARTPETEPSMEEEAALEEDLLEGATDEVTTKLDLARAYLDMGDGEGAKSLLEEVLEEGNDDQRREAGELIEQA